MANYVYTNDQPSTTLWYHDHGLGMTRNNVYAGPAGFWLIREPNGGETGLAPGKRNKLPGPAPVAGEGVLNVNVHDSGQNTARSPLPSRTAPSTTTARCSTRPTAPFSRGSAAAIWAMRRKV